MPTFIITTHIILMCEFEKLFCIYYDVMCIKKSAYIHNVVVDIFIFTYINKIQC